MFFSFWSWDTDKWLLRALYSLYTCHILPSCLFSRSSILCLIIELLMPKVCWSNPHSCSFFHGCITVPLAFWIWHAQPPEVYHYVRYQKQNNHFQRNPCPLFVGSVPAIPMFHRKSSPHSTPQIQEHLNYPQLFPDQNQKQKHLFIYPFFKSQFCWFLLLFCYSAISPV